MTLPPWWALVAGGAIDGATLLFVGLYLAGAFDNWTYRTMQPSPRRRLMAHSPKQEKA